MVSGVFPVTAGRYFLTLLSSVLSLFAGVLAPSSKNDLVATLATTD